MTEVAATVREHCEGVVPLSGRLEPWQVQACARPELLSAWLDTHGSPINLLDLSPMGRNAAELRSAAARFEIDFEISFARKANKSLALVDEAHRLALGVDLASERELLQVLERGVPGTSLIMTAAVKPASLLRLCVDSGTTIVIDNLDELRRLTTVAEKAGRNASVALRLSPVLGDDRLQTRFGFGLDEALAVIDGGLVEFTTITVDGVHFHLDGYAGAERVSAIAEALSLIDGLRDRGHRPSFIDIGGGIPISYLGSARQWGTFWAEHRKGLLGDRDPLTFEGHGLGLSAHDGEIVGQTNVYPYYNDSGRGAWLAEVLAGVVESGGGKRTVAEAIRERGLQLRCEPGRSLLDGCGMTAARVAHRKQRRDGTWLLGVEMNRTQCRSTSDDFMVDPLLIRVDSPGSGSGSGDPPTGPIEGYLVGSYCIERELLTWRRLRFPHGVEVGDIVVFPNTAGYLMHILESSSHQIPLARNLIVGPTRPPFLDPIDQPTASEA